FDHHMPVKAAGAEQRRIQHVGTVGRSKHDHLLMLVKAVHLGEQLIQGLLPLVMAAAEACTAAAAHGIDLVNKDYARRTLFGTAEKVPDPAGTDTDKHFDKLGSGDGEEVDPRLSGYRTCQQGLSGTWRPDQQYPFRNLASDTTKLPRILQIIDNLHQLLLAVFHAGNIVKGDIDLLPGAVHSGSGFGKAAKHPGWSLTAGIAGDVPPDTDYQQPGEQRDEKGNQQRCFGRNGPDLHLVNGQFGNKRRIGRCRHGRGKGLHFPYNLLPCTVSDTLIFFRNSPFAAVPLKLTVFRLLPAS